MMRTRKEPALASYGLLVGGFSSVMLLLNPAMAGDALIEMRTALVNGAFAAIGVAFLVPVLVRDNWLQRIPAIVLLIWCGTSLVGDFLAVAGF